MKTRSFITYILLDLMCAAIFAASFFPARMQTLSLLDFKVTPFTSGLPQAELDSLNAMLADWQAELAFPLEYDGWVADRISLKLEHAKSTDRSAMDGFAFGLRLQGDRAVYDPTGQVLVPLPGGDVKYIEWHIAQLDGNSESASLWISLANPQRLEREVLLRSVPIRFSVRRILGIPVSMYRWMSGMLVIFSSAVFITQLLKKRRML